MGDMIARLKLESGEFDSKVKRATQGLLAMEQECRSVGGTLAILDKEQVDYIKSLGKMDTVSKTVRGQLGELKNAYTDLAVQYKRLTDEEKNGDFGKAITSSLQELKTRIKETEGNLKDVTSEINGGGGLKGALDELAGKFGLNIGQVGKLGVAIGGAQVALKVAKDAFMASDANIDAWGGTVEAATSVYEGFLNALNTGDISGFLDRIGTITTAARQAYDELDALGTLQTVQKPGVSKRETENNRIRTMIQTRRYIEPLDGSAAEPGMKTGDILSDAQVRKFEEQLKNGMSELTEMAKKELEQTNSAIEAVYAKIAATSGFSVSEFKKGTSDIDTFNRYVQGAKDYNKYRNENTSSVAVRSTAGTTLQTVYTGGKNPHEKYKGWDVFLVDGDEYQGLVELILQRDQLANSIYSSQSSGFRAINRAEGITSRIGGGSAGGSGSSVAKQQKEQTVLQSTQSEIAKLTEEALTADGARLEVIKAEIAALKEQEQIYKNIQAYVSGDPLNVKVGVKPDEIARMEAERDQKLKEEAERKASEKKKPAKKEKKDKEQDVDAFKEIVTITTGVGDIVSNLENLGISVPEGIQKVMGGISTVVSVLTTISAIVSAIQAIQSASSIMDFIPFFANGGVVPKAADGYYVPGNRMSGDTTPVLANAGELILNRAAQGNLVSALSGSQTSSGPVSAIIDADTIRVVLQNGARKRGKTISNYLTL
jgi:hypothetical protein